MQKYRFTLAVCFVVWSLSFFIQCGTSFAADSSGHDYTDAFPSEAVASWRKIQEVIHAGCAVESYTRRVGNDPNLKTVSRMIQISGDSEMAIYNSVNLTAKNERYAFRLDRTPDKLDRAPDTENWYLVDIADHPQVYLDDSTNVLLGTHDVFEGIMIENTWLEKFVLSPDFSVIKIERTDLTNGTELLTITFQCRYNLDDHNAIRGGTLVFITSNHWALSEYDILASSKIKKNGVFSEVQGRIKKTFEYQNLNGIPFPKKIVSESYADGFPASQIETLYGEVSSIVDPKVFYLSHYGFSEPEYPSKWGTTFRIISIIIGILMILLGLYLRYLARKKS